MDNLFSISLSGNSLYALIALSFIVVLYFNRHDILKYRGRLRKFKLAIVCVEIGVILGSRFVMPYVIFWIFGTTSLYFWIDMGSFFAILFGVQWLSMKLWYIILKRYVAKNMSEGFCGMPYLTDTCDEDEEVDPLFDEAKALIIDGGKASASLLQRSLKIGYARAALILDKLEDEGVVGPYIDATYREVLVKRDEGVEISTLCKK